MCYIHIIIIIIIIIADPMGNGRMVFVWSPGRLAYWEARKPLTWDVTVICPLADSYVAAAAREAGSAAEEAAIRKTEKYSNIQAHHIFQPVAVESLGSINASGRVFLSKLSRKLADQSGDDREISFLFQRLSVLIQRYNAILLHDCFMKEEEK